MKNWELFVAGQKRDARLSHPFSELVVNKIGAKLRAFLKIPSRQRSNRTKCVMDALSQLGREQGFKSMSHGITITKTERKEGYNNKGFKYGEWLFDLHWYEEKKKSHYQQTSLPLVVECEWDWLRKKDKSGEKYSAIMWDFQKLLVANADLRVLIFRLRDKDSQDLNRDLDEYFTETITGYRNLPVGSKFLFVAFDKDGFWYSEKTKP